MKAVFIAFDQAHFENIIHILDNNLCTGFTSFGETTGRGSNGGEPHYGTHAWPSLGGSILTIVEDEKLNALLSQLHQLDLSKPLLGLRAFAWEITDSI